MIKKSYKNRRKLKSIEPIILCPKCGITMSCVQSDMQNNYTYTCPTHGYWNVNLKINI